MKINVPIGNILPFQESLRPALPTVVGNVDYMEFERELHRIDELLRLSGVEQLFVRMSMGQWEKESREAKKERSHKARLHYQKQSFAALRCTVLMSLLGEPYRGMSRRLAECALFRWFCRLEELETVRVPAKSTLQEYAHWLPVELMSMVIQTLSAAAMEVHPAGVSALNLANAIELEWVWMDTTCVKANIHFPVDWVLLRDAIRTLMKAMMLIRRHGLKHRMSEPALFLKKINRLCIQMTHNRRAADSRKQRKRTLRQMKELVGCVAAHARRYRSLLDQQWECTDWTRKQAEQVLRRIDGVMTLLPRAKKQAHERIIGGRQVDNAEKILSLYERELHVIVRGKADAEVEFGNELLLAEQKDGLIVDWAFYQQEAPADCRMLPESLQRMENAWGWAKVRGLGADRGFESASNLKLLNNKRIFNAICPKDPAVLRQRMKEPQFATMQKRRSQTEGRIAIFKNAFLGRPLRSKGFARRHTAIVWNILAHNLWLLARLPTAEEEEVPIRKAA